jgi:hypothetical protein
MHQMELKTTALIQLLQKKKYIHILQLLSVILIFFRECKNNNCGCIKKKKNTSKLPDYGREEGDRAAKEVGVERRLHHTRAGGARAHWERVSRRRG